jgi:GNAT superfamily N-acetyltransferase
LGDTVNSVSILPARPGDVAVLAKLLADFRDHLQGHMPSDEEFKLRLPSSLDDPGVLFACAWLKGEAVGFTQTRFWKSVWVGGTEAQLEDLFVIPSARAQGVGRALLQHVLGQCVARGAQRVGLKTNELNHAAQKLYLSEGLSVQTHRLYPSGREVFWTKSLGAAQAAQQPVAADGHA